MLTLPEVLSVDGEGNQGVDPARCVACSSLIISMIEMGADTPNSDCPKPIGIANNEGREDHAGASTLGSLDMISLRQAHVDDSLHGRYFRPDDWDCCLVAFGPLA
jgi:hypothetical protein